MWMKHSQARLSSDEASLDGSELYSGSKLAKSAPLGVSPTTAGQAPMLESRILKRKE